jgi:hypothetical protein
MYTQNNIHTDLLHKRHTMQTSQAAISTPAQAIATPITMGSLKTFKTSVIVVQLLSTSQRFGAIIQLLVTLLHLQEFLLQLLTSTIIMKYLQCMICHTVGCATENAQAYRACARVAPRERAQASIIICAHRYLTLLH